MLDAQGTRARECTQRKKTLGQCKGIEQGEKRVEGSDLCGRMSKKIRSQATELANLTERLQKQQAYSRLVEARLLELNPAHSLPVTPRHLVGTDAASVRNNPKRPFDENGRRDHNSNKPNSRVEEPEDSVREGYRAAQERLKDAARLIRHLREALATRDAEANIAEEHARKFEREANELRHTSGSGVVGDGTVPGGSTVEAAGGSQISLKKHVSRLKRELQEQQQAYTAAKTEGSKLKAALELRSRDLGLGPEGSGVAAELAAAKSTIDNLRAEIAQFRLKPASVGPVAYGNSRKACGSFRHNSSNAGNDRQPRQGGWASEGADRRKTGSRTNVADDKTGTDASAGAEREALLDYVQDLLGKINDLEAALSGRETEHAETSRQLGALREDLRGADLTIATVRRESSEKEQGLQEVLTKLIQLQEDNTSQQSEKNEMERLYEELLRQLKTAEEQKDELQAKARKASKRDEDGVDKVKCLREQLDQCRKRLADAESMTAERVKRVEEETLARENALSQANSRLAKLDILETEIAAQAKDLKASREESQALKDAISMSASRLEKLDALEIDMTALKEELNRCQQEKEEIENSLAEEKLRTLHLVDAMKDIEEEGETKRSKERAAIARAERLQKVLQQKEVKVDELHLLCEELEKRVASLQSGEEVKGVRRQVTEAFGLAERQDQLLGDTSAKLLQLKDDSRDLQEQLCRAKETLRNVWDVLEPAVNAARSWLCFENIDDGVDRVVVAKGSNLACDATEWEGRRDEKEQDVEDSLEALAREASESILRLLADNRCAWTDPLSVDNNEAVAGSSSGGDCTHSDHNMGSSLCALSHNVRRNPCTTGTGAVELGLSSRCSRALVRSGDCHDRDGGGTARATITSGCEGNTRLLRSPPTNDGIIVNRPTADHARSWDRSVAWKKDDYLRGNPTVVNNGCGGGLWTEGGSISCSATTGHERADARNEPQILVAIAGERHNGDGYTRRRGKAGMALSDEESFRRVESIRRGTGGERKPIEGVKARRRGYLEERRRCVQVRAVISTACLASPNGVCYRKKPPIIIWES